MSVNLKDKNSLDLMKQLEGKSWIDYGDIHSFSYILKEFLQFDQKIKKMNLSELEEFYERDLFGEVIYGAGGMNRYRVNGNGNIILLANKSISKTIMLAKSLGFDIE